MRLSAALVLPRDVLNDVVQLVAGVRAEPKRSRKSADTSAAGRHAAPPSKKLGRRKSEDRASSAHLTEPLLDLVPPPRMHVPIARFGNLALADVARLGDSMELQAAEWPCPRLHLHGGVVLDPQGDASVWVELAGDLDELNAVVRGVSRVAQGLHVYVNRREFRPHVQVGTANSKTTEAHVEQVLAALEAYKSKPWRQTSLVLTVPDDRGSGHPPYKVHREIPLGASARR